MPTYVYRREDGTVFELFQRITEDALTVDPETGQKVQRVISGAGLIFKGEGFYLTDYVRKNGNGQKHEQKAEEKVETKPAASDESTKGTDPAVEKKPSSSSDS